MEFVTSTNFEKVRKQFNYGSGKPKTFQKQTIVLQCYPNIPRRVKIINDNWTDFNENKNVFKYLNEVTLSDDWFPCEYIVYKVNNNVDKTKVRLAGA